MMNALEGRQQNNNDNQQDDVVDDNSNPDDESSQDELVAADQAARAARADEDFIKRYNQCKSKEFKGTSGATEVEDWIRITEIFFKAMICTDVQKVRLATFSMHGQAQIWWESKERELSTPG